MKKILLFLLLSVAGYGQVETGQEQEMPYGIKNSGAQTVTTADYIGTSTTDGVQGKILGENIPVNVIPATHHLTPTEQNIKGYIQGIDNAIGNIPITTAGNITRVWFTADQTTIGAGTFNLSNATGKGTATADSPTQTVTNNDDEKKYFARDIIGIPFVSASSFPAGTYSGNLSVSTTPNSASQRFTVELYKCNNAGTPIASGISGAPVGDLGVTVILILDSGVVNLTDASVTNLQVSATLTSQLLVGVGERIRYHVSAAKVGTASASITESVYYGNLYNSYLDVPTPITSSGVVNVSTVTGADVTAALDNLNVAIDGIINSLPDTYATVVYFNDTNPATATIFDDENPPTVNNPLLEDDTDNLYIGTDASTWVYNGSIYVTEAVPETSNFYFSGTTIDAGVDKSSAIYRAGAIQSSSFINSTTGFVINKNGSNTVNSGGRFAFYNAGYTEANMFQLNASNGVDLWNYASGVWNKRFTFSNTGDFTTVGYISAPLKVRKISTNTTLADSDNGTIILLTASCTVTLPNGLMSGFNCSFSTQTGATMTYALGGSVTLINNVGTTMAQNLSHTIVNTGTSNEYLTAGSL